jgi:hypothetical protein
VEGGNVYAFVVGNDGNLWMNAVAGPLSWFNERTPSGEIIASPVGAVTVDDTRPYAFVIGSDGKLWLNWWAGSAWLWSNQGGAAVS